MKDNVAGKLRRHTTRVYSLGGEGGLFNVRLFLFSELYEPNKLYRPNELSPSVFIRG